MVKKDTHKYRVKKTGGLLRSLRRKKFFFKGLTVFVLLNLLLQTFYPTVAMALTGGPSQSEMEAFEPAGNTNMVDLSSGSFTYNIPLMDVEGYPINLSYHSGITMDQEASWVGLGWNINAGEINRQMRGLPDDFNGDVVTQTYNMKDNITVGLDAGAQLKVFGIPAATLSAGIFYNNYKGPGMNYGLSASLSSGGPNGGGLTGSLGINFNSQSGVDISPSVGFTQEESAESNNSNSLGIGVGTSYNSRTGLKGITMYKEKNGSPIEHSLLSFAYPTYTPTMTMPLNNYSITLDATVGLALFGVHTNACFSGFLNDESLASNTLSLPSYGYMCADQAKDNPYALHDFNREKDVPFMPSIANLPITNFTYDLFSINGQGISGQFRPFRGDVGVLYDHECSNTSLSGSVGAEFGFTELTHIGVQLGFNSSNTTTDKWIADNNFCSTVDFQALQPGNINYEPFYIKSTGEKTVNDVSYYNSIANTWPTRVHLDQSGSTVTAKNMFDYSTATQYIPGNLTKTRREKRNQSTSIMNVSEASGFGLDKSINSYPLNKSVYGSCTNADSITHLPRCQWPAHHISEITVTNPDGKRYVYGIPAYNTVQNEATFAVSTGINTSSSNYYLADSTNLVSYTPGTDNSVSNSNGLDNYFNEQQIPPYSHSFLLTGILSPDYVDLTNDGITDDDLGEAVKFNYTQVYSQAKPYRWRTPFEQNSASYQIGLMSYSDDDKANYLYGEKEVWYTHSIESKTMVAQFVLENRQDGFGVLGENGGIDNTRPLKCIKEIDLYSKADLIKNGSNAVPIKTVHFVYNYNLCPSTPNSTAGGGGKLTLQAVYFTYGNNTEGSLNSYTFSYSSFNPPYSHNHYDRWGYFKDNPTGLPPNEDFSYTLQDSARTNKFSTAWNMTGINLPSGGNITVKYESNDYGYVQNQRAGQMFLIRGIGLNAVAADSSGNKLYGSGSNNDWVFVDLPTPITSDQDFYNKYLSGVDSSNSSGNPNTKLYFRFLTNVGNISTPAYEYVPGYCDIAPYSSGPGGYKMITSHMGAIQLSDVNSGDKFVGNANPITLASWQFARLNLPWIAYPGSKVTGSPLSIIEFLLGIIPEVTDIFTGFDYRAHAQNFGKYIIPSHSYIRLDNPNYKKLGGGARVKEIDISDDWASMASGQSSFQYGQTFNYSTTLSSGQVVSNGVATYEPIMGGDENPLRQPLPYDEKSLLAPNNAFYTETPLGESMYPSPSIVYSKVTVADLKYKGVSRTATGYTVNEFYTAKDFPVQNSWTDPDPIRIKPGLLQSIFNVGVQDFMTVSQGFVVEVNDMAGKEKDQKVYDNTGSLISSVQYYYKTDNPSAPSQHLNNDVSVIDPTGAITTASVGKDIDVWQDMREQDTQTTGTDMNVNNENFIIPLGIFPLLIDIALLLPGYSSSHTRFRSAVTTKYIHRTGLLDHVVKTQNGSETTTQNLLYDGETGDVVLTQTNNEFNKPIYSFTYPAHWAYNGMAGAYQNIGAAMSGVTTHSTGTFSTPNNTTASAFFAPGDELEFSTVTGGLSTTKLWVIQPIDSLVLVDVNGSPASLKGASLKVIRSGRRNMESIPVGTVESMKSPINTGGTGLNTINATLNILQASGTLFNDLWQVPINNVTKQVCYSVSAPPDSCIAKFFDSLEVHHQIFSRPVDSIKFGKYVPACTAYAKDLYYAISGTSGIDQDVVFRAQLGDCVLTLTSYGINLPTANGFQHFNTPVSLDSLYTVRSACVNFSSGTFFLYNNGTDTTGGCINLYGLPYMPAYAYYNAASCSGSGTGTVTIKFSDGQTATTGVYSGSSLAVITSAVEQAIRNQTTYTANMNISGTYLKVTAPLGSAYNGITAVQSYSVVTSGFSYTLSSPYNYKGPTSILTLEAPQIVPNTGLSCDSSFNLPVRGSLCISCTTCHDTCENLAVNSTFNPYALGMKGNWRPERNYVYYDSRSPSLASTTSDIWKNGVFNHFNQIWDLPSGSSWPLDTADKNWTWPSRCTKYDLKGNEIEEVDALGRYSSVLYGYISSLPTAVSSNAQFKEIAFDGFEDYGFNNTCSSTCDNSHFSFLSYISDTTSTQAHTGKYSLKLNPGGNATVTRSINYYTGAFDSTTHTKFYLLNGGNIPLFSPDSGNYLLSAWVKESTTCGVTGYTKDTIKISYTGSSLKYAMLPSGPVIEGWQRFESRFKVPGKATAIAVELIAGNNTAYYDDIRIEPFAAEMKTYVYDPRSLRLLGTLDENNYATMYEYNDEGILMRVKKETERGIMTIKENRSSYPRK